MYSVELFSCSGVFEYQADSIPDFDEINAAMKYLKGYIPCWLIMAALGKKEK